MCSPTAALCVEREEQRQTVVGPSPAVTATVMPNAKTAGVAPPSQYDVTAYVDRATRCGAVVPIGDGFGLPGCLAAGLFCHERAFAAPLVIACRD